jgi:hypothetical protein
MPTVRISPISDAQFFDNNGDPLAGGKLFYYVGGSFTVQKTTYADASGATPNPNPIVLNSSGRPTANAFLVVNEPYNIQLTTTDSTTVLNSWGNVQVSTGGGGGSGAVNQILAGTNVTISPLSGTGTVTINATGGAGNPAGPNNSVQYNSGGTFAGTSTLVYDNSAKTLTLGTTGSTGTLVFSGTDSSVTSIADINLYPNTSTGVVRVGTPASNSTITGNSGNTLTITGDTGLTLVSNSNDITFTLDNTATPKIGITGPTAIQYATGLADNDLVNKYYVDNNGGGGSTGVMQIIAGTNVTISPTSGTGIVTINSSGGGGGITGPAVTTNTAIALWDGTTGAALQNSRVTSNTSTGEITIDGTLKIGVGPSGGSTYNVYMGDGTHFLFNTTGTFNIAVGSQAARSNIIGNDNVAIGRSAMWRNVGGNNNVAIGQSAGYEILGNRNVMIGAQAGEGVAGSNNICIGGVSGEYGMTDTVLISPGYNTVRLRINENGAWSFTNPYNFESYDYGATGTVVMSEGPSAHPNWRPANAKVPSYVELGDPVIFGPSVAGKVMKKDAGTIRAQTGTFTADDFYMVYNTSTSTNLIIEQMSGITVRLAGTSTTGNRTVVPYGFAKVWCVSATECIVSGDGVT